MTDYVAEPDNDWLGLDLGTQSVQAMMVSTTGEVLGNAGAAIWASLGYYHMQPSWALPKLLWLINELERRRTRTQEG